VVEELIFFILVVLRLGRLGEAFDLVVGDAHLIEDVLDRVDFLDVLIEVIVAYFLLGALTTLFHLNEVAALVPPMLPSSLILVVLRPTPPMPIFNGEDLGISLA